MIESFTLLPIVNNFNIKVELLFTESLFNDQIVFNPDVLSQIDPTIHIGSSELVERTGDKWVFRIDFFSNTIERNVLVQFPSYTIIRNIPLTLPVNLSFVRPKRMLEISRASMVSVLDFKTYLRINLKLEDPGIFKIPIVFDNQYCMLKSSSNVFWDEDNGFIYFFIMNETFSTGFIELRAIPSLDSLNQTVNISFPLVDNTAKYIFPIDVNYTFTTKSSFLPLEIISPPNLIQIDGSFSSTYPIKVLLSNLTNFVTRIHVTSDDPNPFFEVLNFQNIFSIDESGKIILLLMPSLGEYHLQVRITTRFEENILFNVTVVILQRLSTLYDYTFRECRDDICYEISSFIETKYYDECLSEEDYPPEKKSLRIGKKSRDLSFREVLADLLSLIEFIVVSTISIDFKINATDADYEMLSLILGQVSSFDLEEYLLAKSPTDRSCLYNKRIKDFVEEIFLPMKRFYLSFLDEDVTPFNIKISNSKEFFGMICFSRN